MAKKRRVLSRSSPERPKRRPVQPPAVAEPRPQRHRAELAAPLPPTPAHLEAVALYERGLEALQRHSFDAAAGTFRDVLARFPEEREIHERARLYLKVCERQVGGPSDAPRTAEERLLSATVALNAGDFEGALSRLRQVQAESPENDHAEYMLAVIAAARGNQERSLEHLRRAIELNPENKILARQDPDLELLRADEAFRSMVEPLPGVIPGRRRRSRPAR